VRYDPLVAHTGRFVLAAALTASTAVAFDASLDRRGIDQAIDIGHSRIESVRRRFHQAYRLSIGHAPVDYIEVITPFRRVEIEAETRERNGSRALSQREALELLAAAPDQIDLFIELTFHPLNTYIGVPAYEVRLVRAGGAPAAIAPRTLERFPRYGARVEGLPLPYPAAGSAAPRRSEPVLGGTVVARFDARLLDSNGVYDVVVSEAGKEIVRARTDFRALR
jgi:hypothetical protein